MEKRICTGLKVNMLLEEIKNIKETKKDLRKFGLTVGIALLIISGILLWSAKDSFIYFGSAGITLLLVGLILPQVLKPLNKAWMTLALLMGWVMTRVILTILFYIVVTPTAFFAKVFKKKFLELKIDRSGNSYWELRGKKPVTPKDYEKQF